MLNFPEGGRYKIEFVDGKGGFIASDHKTKTLYISKALKLNITNGGKLQAVFGENSANACGVTISDPSVFNYCIQKDGEYRLSGSNITFDGTDEVDRLVLNECVNSKIDLGKGNDEVKIEDFGYPIIFSHNKIKTGNGDDNVTVMGKFKKFANNEFYLGKGSDTFSAEINPQDDVLTYKEFEEKIPKYGDTVARNEIYAIDGYTKDGDTKGWFENNIFEAKTYSANQLFKYISGGDNMLDGFQMYNFKPEPMQVFKALTNNQSVQQTKNASETPKKSTYREKHEQAQKRYQIYSLLYNLTGKAEFAEKLGEASKEAAELCLEN